MKTKNIATHTPNKPGIRMNTNCHSQSCVKTELLLLTRIKDLEAQNARMLTGLKKALEVIRHLESLINQPLTPNA